MNLFVKRFAIALVAGLALYFALTALLSGADTNYSPPKKVKIATWNLEWFGAYHRTEEDLKSIAEIIGKEGIDILCLQEIVSDCRLKRLAEILEWDYFLSPQRVPQKLALLWNPRRVEEVRFEKAAYKALERVAKHGLGYDSRQPLVFSIKAGEFDFTLMNVHLKSNPENEKSLEIRAIQYNTINNWLNGELQNPGGEKDIIIAGDFNSYNHGISSQVLRDAGHVSFITTELGDADYSSIYYTYSGDEPVRRKSLIDHFAITDELRSGEYWKIRPIKNWDQTLGEEAYEYSISDHLPVVAIFHAEKDID